MCSQFLNHSTTKNHQPKFCYMKKKNNYPRVTGAIIMLAFLQAAMLVFSGALALRWYWLLSPTFASWILILITAAIDIFIIQPREKRNGYATETHQCPNCEAMLFSGLDECPVKIWTASELAADECFKCGYPYDNDEVNSLINLAERPSKTSLF
jgi:hypothetical protein